MLSDALVTLLQDKYGLSDFHELEDGASSTRAEAVSAVDGTRRTITLYKTPLDDFRKDELLDVRERLQWVTTSAVDLQDFTMSENGELVVISVSPTGTSLPEFVNQRSKEGSPCSAEDISHLLHDVARDIDSLNSIGCSDFISGVLEANRIFIAKNDSDTVSQASVLLVGIGPQPYPSNSTPQENIQAFAQLCTGLVEGASIREDAHFESAESVLSALVDLNSGSSDWQGGSRSGGDAWSSGPNSGAGAWLDESSSGAQGWSQATSGDSGGWFVGGAGSEGAAAAGGAGFAANSWADSGEETTSMGGAEPDAGEPIQESSPTQVFGKSEETMLDIGGQVFPWSGDATPSNQVGFPADSRLGGPTGNSYAVQERTAPVHHSRPAPKRKSGAGPWVALLLVLVVLGGLGAAGYVFRAPLLSAYRELVFGESEWSNEDQEILAAFPAILGQRDGAHGWGNLRCESKPPEKGRKATVSCADERLNVTIHEYESRNDRDKALPGGGVVVIGRDSCQVNSKEITDQEFPAYALAPSGEKEEFMIVINGPESENKRLELPICEAG